MAISKHENSTGSNSAASGKQAAQQVLLNEAQLSLELSEIGISFNSDEIRPFQDPVELASPFNRQGGLTGFYLPHGITARSSHSRWTPYALVVEDNRPVLYDEKTRIGEISFIKPLSGVTAAVEWR